MFTANNLLFAAVAFVFSVSVIQAQSPAGTINGGQPVTAASGDEVTCVISGLQPGATYAVNLYAAAGWGETPPGYTVIADENGTVSWNQSLNLPSGTHIVKLTYQSSGTDQGSVSPTVSMATIQ